MNDWWFDLVEVSEGVGDLHDDGTSFFLRHQLVLLQIEVQIVPLAELQHRAEPGASPHRTRTGDYAVVYTPYPHLTWQSGNESLLSLITMGFSPFFLSLHTSKVVSGYKTIFQLLSGLQSDHFSHTLVQRHHDRS